MASIYLPQLISELKREMVHNKQEGEFILKAYHRKISRISYNRLKNKTLEICEYNLNNRKAIVSALNKLKQFSSKIEYQDLIDAQSHEIKEFESSISTIKNSPAVSQIDLMKMLEYQITLQPKILENLITLLELLSSYEETKEF